MALTSPWIESLRPVPGSVRLILLRWLLAIGAGLPGLALGTSAIGDAGARQPWFTDAPRPFPLAEQMAWLERLPAGLWAALAIGAVIGWSGGLLLTAGAVEVLDPRRVALPRVCRAVFDTGARAWFPYLRVAALALVAIALGLGALGAVFGRVYDHAKVAGWTGRTVVVALPLIRAALAILWIALVGSCAFWANVLVVADRRRRVRRLAGIVPRLAGRRPVRALLAHVVVGLASLVLGAAVLVAWRQSARLDPTPWIALWCAVLLVQAFVWHWRLRACRLTLEDPRLADLLRTPDEPWRIGRRVGGWVRARAARRDAVPEPEESAVDGP